MKANTVIRNQNLFCLNCGDKQVVPYPIDTIMFGAMVTAFNKIHKNCEPTWKEPKVDQSKTTEEKANFWLTNGEHGSSSMAMYRAFMDNPVNKSRPLDPDDFRRCYLLLKTVPEWRNEMHKIKALSPAWSNLVDYP